MGKHSCHFFLLALLHQGVKKYNALVFEEAVHVGVAVRAAGRAINEEELSQGELEGTSQRLNLVPASQLLLLSVMVLYGYVWMFISLISWGAQLRANRHSSVDASSASPNIAPKRKTGPDETSTGIFFTVLSCYCNQY